VSKALMAFASNSFLFSFEIVVPNWYSDEFRAILILVDTINSPLSKAFSGILVMSHPPRCLSEGLWPWYRSIILSKRGANTVYEDSEPAYTPMLEFGFYTPELMAYWSVKPISSVLPLHLLQTSSVRNSDNNDLVPGAKTGFLLSH
jgi:hypothetical protein